MNINKTKLIVAITPLITLVLGYYGFQPIQELRSPPPADVDVEITIPEQTQHSHATHKHKDWLPVIREELEKAKAEHTRIHH